MSAALAASAAKSPRIKKSKAAEKKPKSAAKTAHPAWKEIIAEAIANHPEEARFGVSRSTIKRYAETKYGMDMTPANISNLNRAIAHGAETGLFLLPKGPSGKIKLAVKSRSSAKENAKPASPKAKLATATKPTAKPATVTKPSAKPAKATPKLPKSSTNKAVPAKAAAKKPATKASSTKTTSKPKKSSAAPAAKKPMKKSTTKKIPKKEVAAKAAASKRVKKAVTTKPKKPASKKTAA